MEEKMSKTKQSPLHSWKPSPSTWPNRAFALAYSFAILALFYRHCHNLFQSPTLISISFLIADFILAFIWMATQAFLMTPIDRKVFPENLPKFAKESEYPAVDVFICTADPHKEPPVGVVSTALSVMAYDYPMEKLSLYVSDDGGSQLTLFAFMEAAKFARHWLPYCRKNHILDRSPEAYFGHDHSWFSDTHEIKLMYESMKSKIEKVVERGTVPVDYVTDDQCRKAFSKWTNGFTRQQHPTVIQVLLESSTDKDIADYAMPNLIYVSREKSKAKPHNFKAGALNVLLRVSETMTNAPLFLPMDCDMISNDPSTARRALCYFLDTNVDPKLAFVQFPQRFRGINKSDIYASEFKQEVQIFPPGMDGLLGASFQGTGGFFRRQALYGAPSSLAPSTVMNASRKQPNICSDEVLALAHRVAACGYEDNTKWGSQMGFRYGSLTEDVYTSYHLHCQGWKSSFCDPKRAAFLGNAPISLNDILNQTRRWFMGLLEIAISKYSPLTFGLISMNPLQALCYANYSLRALWAIPIIIYAFVPQLALVNSLSIFPKVSDAWFSLYAFLFFGAYGEQCLHHLLAGGSFSRWWSLQRMWMVWGVSSHPLALLDLLLKSLGIASFGFNVTSKVVDDEQSKRYEQGIFEFGLESPLFFTIATAAMVNLFAFLLGIVYALKAGTFEEMSIQLFISGFVAANGWPIYEAMILRSDEGKMPLKITLASIAATLLICVASSVAF